MRTGLLRDVISIYRTEILQDDFGGSSNQHRLLTTTRTNVGYKTGSREVVNDEIVYTYQVTFEVWQYVNIQEHTDYIMYKDKKYRVLSVIPVPTQQKKVIETELINE
jgi:putative phage head-tail adaptor|nr:MAG TPA: putative head-tail adaptor [Caudoviricetes sp.]